MWKLPIFFVLKCGAIRFVSICGHGFHVVVFSCLFVRSVIRGCINHGVVHSWYRSNPSTIRMQVTLAQTVGRKKGRATSDCSRGWTSNAGNRLFVGEGWPDFPRGSRPTSSGSHPMRWDCRNNVAWVRRSWSAARSPIWWCENCYKRDVPNKSFEDQRVVIPIGSRNILYSYTYIMNINQRLTNIHSPSLIRNLEMMLSKRNLLIPECHFQVPC